MRIAVILGTRPEIIKLSPVIRALERAGVPHGVVHTGQHYSKELDSVFFDELGLPEPRYNLGIGSGSHGAQTGRMLAAIEEVLVQERPAMVVVQGDTNSVLAGALAASKLGIKVGHVEAGLRSNDRNMPEEINRVVTDHLSDYLFAPSELAATILRNEGIAPQKIFNTGNTIVDAVQQNLALAQGQSTILEQLGLAHGKYLLMTTHRQENVDHRVRYEGILQGARQLHDELGLPVVYPIHPRAKKMLEAHQLSSEGLWLCHPLGYLDFLTLEANARLILTDSGGLQEEACILGVPCITLRDNTERPETVAVGANLLVGVKPEQICAGARLLLSRSTDWQQPLGDGAAGKKIAHVLIEHLGNTG